MAGLPEIASASEKNAGFEEAYYTFDLKSGNCSGLLQEGFPIV